MQHDALAGTSQPPVLRSPRQIQSHRRARMRLVAPGLAASLLFLASPRGLQAQTPAAQTPPPSTPPTLPLSGVLIPSESVSVTQQTSPAATPGSSNVINSTVTILPPFTGGTPLGKANQDLLSLSLQQALAMGLRANLGAIEQSAQSQQAEAQRGLAEAGLLPTLNAGIAEAFERENLRTLGVSLQSIPESAKFNFYDARFRLQQSVLDIVKVNSLHTASESLKASLLATRNTRDLIVLAVAGSYLQLISTNARVVAAQAQVETSKTIYKQAADRFEAGLAARIDRDRAQVQYQTEQQRLRSLQADRDTQKLKLSRLIGLPLGQPFTPTDEFPYTPLTTTFDEPTSLTRAQSDRSDIQAAGASVRAAQNNVKATRAERYPTLNVDANFGAAGTTPSFHSTGVYTVYGLLAIPIYEGGRVRADEKAADAALKQRQAELANAHAQADQDVRQAFIDLNAAADQVAVAQSNVQLSHETLTQSRDRFVAGVADTVEVVQAEQAVVQADDDLISAVFEHNLAKVSLARAMGNAEQTLPQLLGRK